MSGSIFIVGFSQSMRTSSEEDWIKVWGGPQEEQGGFLVLDPSGNLYVTGSTSSFGNGSFDIFLLKYDNNGNYLWNVTWGGVREDHAYGIAIDSSSNIYITGRSRSTTTNYSAVLLKYNNNGVLQWNQTWGGNNDDWGNAVVVDSSNDVIIVGQTESFGDGGFDIFTTKYNNIGMQQWNETWGDPQDEGGLGVAIDASNNIYVSGFTSSFGAGGKDVALLKYDQSGNPSWDITWGGTQDDSGEAVTVDSNGDILVAGITRSFGSGTIPTKINMLLIKFNSTSNQQWNQTWGGQYTDFATSLVTGPANRILLCGSTQSFGEPLLDNLNIILYESNGSSVAGTLWYTNIWHVPYSIQLDSINNVYCAGEAEYAGQNVFLVKNPQAERPIPEIPGYDLSILILLTLGTIIAIVVIKIRKNRKK